MNGDLNNNVNPSTNAGVNVGTNSNINPSTTVGVNTNIDTTVSAGTNVNTVINTNSVNSEVLNSTEVLQADNSSNTPTSDENYVYVPPSKFRYFLLIVFFFILLGMIIFLPEITEIVNLRLFGNDNVVEKIVDGTLECSLKKTGTSLDTVFNAKFSYTDLKLDKLTFSTTINGDAKLDYGVLNQNYNDCLMLKDSVQSIDGVAISCDLAFSSVVTTESIRYNVVDIMKATSAFGEAGGVFPEFESREDINKIEREMNASGYTCNKYK